MIRLKPRRSATAATILLLSYLAACGHTGATRYLSLPAIPPATPPDAAAAPVSVGRLSVRWPAAFDRMEVVRPAGDVEVEVEEFVRWSAAPGELATAALLQDLQSRLASLTLTPAGDVLPSGALDISVQVIGLEARKGTWSLTASVAIGDAVGAKSLRRTFTVSAPAAGSDAEAQAEVLGRLLAAVADWIVLDLTGQVGGPVEPPAVSASRQPIRDHGAR
jgi:uncharacterized lipoprotein YmbA